MPTKKLPPGVTTNPSKFLDALQHADEPEQLVAKVSESPGAQKDNFWVRVMDLDAFEVETDGLLIAPALVTAGELFALYACCDVKNFDHHRVIVAILQHDAITMAIASEIEDDTFEVPEAGALHDLAGNRLKYFTEEAGPNAKTLADLVAAGEEAYPQDADDEVDVSGLSLADDDELGEDYDHDEAEDEE